MTLSRRALMVGVAAVSAATVAGGQEAEPTRASGDFAGGSKVFKTSSVERTKLPNGGERLSGFMGTLATGETASMHESWIAPGTPAPALHRIMHSEMVAVLEGEVEFEHDGTKELAVAGDVIYVAYGTVHAMRNAGTGTARYMVFQVGK